MAPRRPLALLTLLPLLLTAAACSTISPKAAPTSTTLTDAASTATSTSSAASDESTPSSDPTDPTEAANRTDTADTAEEDVVESVTPPESAAELAIALTATERTIRDPSVSLDEALTAGRRLQLLYSVFARNPEWAPTVLESVGDDIAPDVADHWEARQSLSSLVTSTTLATNLPAWRIVNPLPPDELVALYQDAEAATGIGWEYLAAINLVETRMGRIIGYSTAGAVGPMQFLPSTWAECCEGDPTIPADAIHGAAVYLTHRGGPDDMPRALRGYNNSDYYVVAVSAYARIIERNPLAYRGFWAFEVYFRTASGVVHLPVGYNQPEPIPVDEWLAVHPETLTPD